MNEAALKEKLAELTEALSASGKFAQSKEGSSQEGVYEPTARPDAAELEESVDYLRVQVKYLLFDLEATRRENRYLRQMLENRHRRGDAGEDDDNRPRWR